MRNERLPRVQRPQQSRTLKVFRTHASRDIRSQASRIQNAHGHTVRQAFSLRLFYRTLSYGVARILAWPQATMTLGLQPKLRADTRTHLSPYIRNNPPFFPPNTTAPMIEIPRNTIAHTPSAAANSCPLPRVDSSE